MTIEEVCECGEFRQLDASLVVQVAGHHPAAKGSSFRKLNKNVPGWWCAQILRKEHPLTPSIPFSPETVFESLWPRDTWAVHSFCVIYNGTSRLSCGVDFYYRLYHIYPFWVGTISG